MAFSMNLRDLTSPQYSAVTGKKKKTPYTSYLTAMGPSVRDAARQDQLDSIRQNELAQSAAQFNASQALERENNAIQADQAAKAGQTQGLNTVITAAGLADKAGLINLKDVATPVMNTVSNVAGGAKDLVASGVQKIWPSAPPTAPVAPTVDPAQAYDATATAADAVSNLAPVAETASTSGSLAATPAATEAALGSSYAGEGVAAGLEAKAAYDAAALSASYAGETAAASGAGAGIGGFATGAGIAGAAILARKGLGAILSNQSHSVPKWQGKMMQEQPTLEGLSNNVMSQIFGVEDNQDVKNVEMVLDPVGTVLKKAGCIIVTACTAADSKEVNITREYRDQFLTTEQLRGYYMIAERVVPLINRFSLVKWLVKRLLVDNLVAYGKHELRKGPTPGMAAIIITRGFLALCGAVGSREPSFVRCNGDII